jgi:hypothetical protein
MMLRHLRRTIYHASRVASGFILRFWPSGTAFFDVSAPDVMERRTNVMTGAKATQSHARSLGNCSNEVARKPTLDSSYMRFRNSLSPIDRLFAAGQQPARSAVPNARRKVLKSFAIRPKVPLRPGAVPLKPRSSPQLGCRAETEHDKFNRPNPKSRPARRALRAIRSAGLSALFERGRPTTRT